MEEEIVPACLAYGIGLIPYLPLAGGALTGKYRRGQERPADTRGAKRPGSFDRMLTDHTYDVIEKLESYAADHGHPLSELAIAWLLAKPAVSVVIAGASRTEQVEANAKAAEWHLTPGRGSGDRRASSVRVTAAFSWGGSQRGRSERDRG